MLQFFVTGTDTEVGKTYVSIRLLKEFNQLGLSTLGIKPVASGCIRKDNKLYNEDAKQLQQASSIQLPYDVINPLAFEPAIAPHIAAQQISCKLNLTVLNEKLRPALEHPADVSLIEGFGGWYAPLNHKEVMADFVIQHHLPVILVVGIRLGCINHSILTLRALQQDGIKTLGWIANCINPKMEVYQENIDSLQAWLPVPCLGIVEHNGGSIRGFDSKKILAHIKH